MFGSVFCGNLEKLQVPKKKGVSFKKLYTSLEKFSYNKKMEITKHK